MLSGAVTFIFVIKKNGVAKDKNKSKVHVKMLNCSIHVNAQRKTTEASLAFRTLRS